MVYSGRYKETLADENDIVWFIIGTDSKFENLTASYYVKIIVVLVPK